MVREDQATAWPNAVKTQTWRPLIAVDKESLISLISVAIALNPGYHLILVWLPLIMKKLLRVCSESLAFLDHF